MHSLLAELYGSYGITRMIEGGIVNNVPAEIGFTSAMEGRLGGHRNVHVLAVDCFAPRTSKPLFLPIQKVVRGNVQRARLFADTWLSLNRTLSPLNLVPSAAQISEAGRWSMSELGGDIKYLEALFTPIPSLED